MGLFEVVGAGLDGQASGHFRHRRQQWQTAGTTGDGFIGNTGRAAVHEILCLFGIGCQVKVGEQDLAFRQHRPFDRLRLLHLDDHFRLVEDFLGGADDLSSRSAVGVVIHADTDTCARLDNDLVPVRHNFTHRRRRHANTKFFDLDFLWNTDQHFIAPYNARLTHILGNTAGQPAQVGPDAANHPRQISIWPHSAAA